MSEKMPAPADQRATRELLNNMRHNGALNDGEHRALFAALREDLVNAVWAARRETLREEGK